LSNAGPAGQQSRENFGYKEIKNLVSEEKKSKWFSAPTVAKRLVLEPTTVLKNHHILLLMSHAKIFRS